MKPEFRELVLGWPGRYRGGIAMQTLQLADFCIRVPEKYEATRFDSIESTREFLASLGDPLGTQLGKLMSWPKEESRYSYHVAMGEHNFSFGVHPRGNKLPGAYLISFCQSMTRDIVSDELLFDIRVGDWAGKGIGDYTGEFSSLMWCLAIDESQVEFAFSGPGCPSDDVRKDVEAMIQSLSRMPVS